MPEPEPPPALTDYVFGRIHVDGEPHDADLVVLPDRVIAGWRRKRGHRLQVVDMAEIFEAEPEILVVGQGYFGLMKVGRRVEKELARRNIKLHAQRTGRAVSLYESLRADHRVAAALHLTC